MVPVLPAIILRCTFNANTVVASRLRRSDAPLAPSEIYPGITHLGDARAYSPQHTSAIVTG